MCFEDRTFCPYFRKCTNGKTCQKALTTDVWQRAKDWWGEDNPPVAVFAEKPKCFVEEVSEGEDNG